ncbi:DUF4244 domain-containing protein [Corynebacterium jeikeium]|jgi:Flp pilus assembly pilin Flp|uniref:DUF4244 domain-containing protein n=1 Tax=Corynebacterium jeikeium TaxID=38289 RepID=UPI0002DA8BB6|nr:hypothetical protein CJEIK_10640 [Corynebacterium jeikeium]SCX24718.1 hypothetical protein CJBVI_1912 [Corynebacterium jeikeium]SQI19094.1 Uncharacterised protein [Corynebacterium jeikeium]SUY82281.1 Uncharacterised protein [Corynebacterium jeikeium]
MTTPTMTAPLTPTPTALPSAVMPVQVKAAPVKTDPSTGISEETHSELHPIARWWNQIIGAIYSRYTDERGMSTIEYALGCVAAAALGALLYTVVTSDTVEQALSGIFEKALNTK